MSTDGNAPLEDNSLKVRKYARTPFLGLQRREPPILLRPDDPESRQNNIQGTSALRIYLSVAL
eukprot:7882015-Pyramimonas_sp.AAC.1